MITRDFLTHFLDEYLCCQMYKDYAPNGLQVAGKADIQKVCTAVSASKEVIMRAIEEGADALLVHHGFFWKGEDASIIGIKRERIKPILAHDLNLFAYHLPLDGHAKIGNNACLARLLDFDDVSAVSAQDVPGLLWSGSLKKPVGAPQWVTHLTKVLKRPPLFISGGDHAIRRIAWCSGGAQHLINQAAQLGVDAYLSGEVSERTYYEAQELGIHYFACGHHATEKGGIIALGELLNEQFGVVHQYLETDNPV